MYENIGQPSFIDPIENKYFYYNEKRIIKNFFSDNIVERNLAIFEFDINEKIISTKIYNLDDQKDIELIKQQTSSQIIKEGLLEQVFGGIGTSVPAN